MFANFFSYVLLCAEAKEGIHAEEPFVHRLASAGVPCSALEPEQKTKPPHRSLPE